VITKLKAADKDKKQPGKDGVALEKYSKFDRFTAFSSDNIIHIRDEVADEEIYKSTLDAKFEAGKHLLQLSAWHDNAFGAT